MNQAYLQRHLLAIRPQSLSEAVKAGNEYLQIIQIKPNSNPGLTVRQIEEERTPEAVQVAQSKPTEMEVLLQALHQLTSEVASLKQTQKTNVRFISNLGTSRQCLLHQRKVRHGLPGGEKITVFAC